MGELLIHEYRSQVTSTLFAMANCCKLPLWAHISFAALGFVAGLLGGVIFVVKFVNLHAGVWAFLSCIPSAAVLHLHYLHRRQRIGDVHNENSLNWTIAFASVKIAVSVLAAIIYVAISIQNGIPLLPVETSLYLGAIQALMVTKWSIALAMYAKKYKMFVDGAYGEI